LFRFPVAAGTCPIRCIGLPRSGMACLFFHSRSALYLKHIDDSRDSKFSNRSGWSGRKQPALTTNHAALAARSRKLCVCEAVAVVRVHGFRHRRLLQHPRRAAPVHPIRRHRVRANAAGFTAEVLVVDNASNDGSMEWSSVNLPTRAFRSRFSIAGKPGLAEANNVAIELALGQYLVLLNSDAFCIPALYALPSSTWAPTHSRRGVRAWLARKASGNLRLVHSPPSGTSCCFFRLASRFPKSRIFGAFDRTWPARLAAEVIGCPAPFQSCAAKRS